MHLALIQSQCKHAFSPCCSLYILYGTSWENWLEHQDLQHLVIISFIVMTCLFDQVVTQGEIIGA